MNVPNFSQLMSPIIVKSENLKPFKNYVIKTIFYQRHNKLFDWSDIKDSIWTCDKNYLT